MSISHKPTVPFRQFQEVEPGISIAFALNWGGDTQYPMATRITDKKNLRATFWPDYEDCEVGTGILILNNFTEERRKSDRPCEDVYRVFFGHDGDPELECWGWNYEKLEPVHTSYELTDKKSSPSKPPTILDHLLAGGN